jgi:hypothetical protein
METPETCKDKVMMNCQSYCIRETTAVITIDEDNKQTYAPLCSIKQCDDRKLFTLAEIKAAFWHSVWPLDKTSAPDAEWKEFVNELEKGE